MSGRSVPGHRLAVVVASLLLVPGCTSTPEPGPGPGPAQDELLDELARAWDLATGPDTACLTDRYQSLEGVADLLDGIEIGPGGLRETSAGPEGLAGTAVIGLSLPNVATTLGIDVPSVAVTESVGCRFLWDPATWLGMSVDSQDRVAGFYIASPVVRTVDEIGVGSELAEVEAAYDVTVERFDGYAVAYTPPTTAREVLSEDPLRSMVFELGGPDDRVTAWRVGIPDYVQTGGMCP